MSRKDKILFHEVQYFRESLFILVILCVLIVITCSSGYDSIRVFGKSGREAGETASYSSLFWGLFLLIVINGVFIAFLFFSRLITEVREDGLYVRFIPFHWSFRKYPFRDIKHCEARTNRPIREYGGWGIRRGFNGRAFNVYGARGAQLVLKEDNRLLIGSQKADELAQAIQERMKK